MLWTATGRQSSPEAGADTRILLIRTIVCQQFVAKFMPVLSGTEKFLFFYMSTVYRCCCICKKMTLHSVDLVQQKALTTLSRRADKLRTENTATVIFCKMAFKQQAMPDIASNAVFCTAIRRSSAESLAVRKTKMTKFAQPYWLADVLPAHECRDCADGAGSLWPCVVCRSGLLKVVRGLDEKFFSEPESTRKIGVPTALVQPVL